MLDISLHNISLSSDFEGLNVDSVKLYKKHFLEQLTFGNFIPMRLKSAKGCEQYKHYKLAPTTNKDIGETIKAESSTILNRYNMEASSTEFDFIGLKMETLH